MPNNRAGWCHIQDCKRPFRLFRKISKGRNKNKFEVILGGHLTKAKKYILSADRIIQFPQPA